MSAALRDGVDVHIYPSPFEYESRMLKVTRSLVACGIVSRVLVIGTAKSGLPARQTIDAAREVRRVGTWLRGEGFVAKVLRFAEWSARVLLTLWREPVTMVNCHSLSALPLSVAVKWMHGCTLVYEPHELETETVTSRGIRRRLARIAERLLIGQARSVIAVSASIAAEYERLYGLPKAHVVLNVPELGGDDPAPSRVFRERFQIPDGHRIFLYQGSLEEARGVGWLLDAFLQVTRDRHLVFMGFGPMAVQISAAAARASNIHLHPAVPTTEVPRYTRGADVGIAPLTDDCLNHRFALPNKLFEYVHSGLPVLVSDLPEMRAFVARYACGWVAPNDAAALAACVQEVDAESIERARAGALRARAEMHWGLEEEKLAEIYGTLRREQERPRQVA